MELVNHSNDAEVVWRYFIDTYAATTATLCYDDHDDKRGGG